MRIVWSVCDMPDVTLPFPDTEDVNVSLEGILLMTALPVSSITVRIAMRGREESATRLTSS